MPSNRFRMTLDGKPHPTTQMLGTYGVQCLSHNNDTAGGNGARLLSGMARRLGYDQLYFNTSEQTREVDMAIWEGQQNYVVFCRGTQNGLQLARYLVSIVTLHDVELGQFVLEWAQAQGRFVYETLKEVILQVERRQPGRATPYSITFFGHSLGGAAAYIAAQNMTLDMFLANRDQARDYTPDVQLMTFGEPKSSAGRSALADLLGDEGLLEFFWGGVASTGLPLLFSEAARNGETQQAFVERMVQRGQLPRITPLSHQRIVCCKTADATTSFVPNGWQLQDPITMMPPGAVIDANALGLLSRAIPERARRHLGRVPSPIMNPRHAGWISRFTTGAFWFTLAQVASSRYLLAIVPQHHTTEFLCYKDGIEEPNHNNVIESWFKENFVGAIENALATGWDLHTLDTAYGPMALARYAADKARRDAANEVNIDDVVPHMQQWSNRVRALAQPRQLAPRRRDMPDPAQRRMRLPRYMEDFFTGVLVDLKDNLFAACQHLIQRRNQVGPDGVRPAPDTSQYALALAEFSRLVSVPNSLETIVTEFRAGAFSAIADEVMHDVWLDAYPDALPHRTRQPAHIGNLDAAQQQTLFPLDTTRTVPVLPATNRPSVPVPSTLPAPAPRVGGIMEWMPTPVVPAQTPSPAPVVRRIHR